MIETDDQLQQAHAAVGDMYNVLASYRAKILPVNPRNYVVIAQGPLEEIRKIQAEIDSYLGLKEPLGTASKSPGRPASVLSETPPAFGQGNKPK